MSQSNPNHPVWQSILAWGAATPGSDVAGMAWGAVEQHVDALLVAADTKTSTPGPTAGPMFLWVVEFCRKAVPDVVADAIHVVATSIEKAIVAAEEQVKDVWLPGELYLSSVKRSSHVHRVQF